MRKYVTLALLLIASILTAGCVAVSPMPNPEQSMILGSGIMASESRMIAGVDKILLLTGADLFISVGDSESLLIEAEDNLLPLIETSIRSGELLISTPPNMTINPTQPIRVTIDLMQLDAIRVAGAGVIVIGGLNTQHFKVTLDGAASLRVNGEAAQQEVLINGAGSYNAIDLNSRTVSVTISGSGSATVRSSDQLVAEIPGSGTIFYYGNPRVEQNVQGIGSVMRAGD